MESSTQSPQGATPKRPSDQEIILQDWQTTQQGLRLNLEDTARQAGALIRKREVRNAGDLLRLILMYVLSGWSLRLVCAWALIQGIACLSDVGLLKRFCHSALWLGVLLAQLLQLRCRVL